jgi:very-short-patch-repair endonuclease
LLSGRSLRRLLEETSVQGRRGLTVLRGLVDERGDEYVPPASNLEHRFESVLREAGLPAMRRQVDSGGDRWVGRVDFRDATMPLVVEIQSERYHSALTDRADDAARLAALRAAGFMVVAVTEEQVWHRPHEVVRQVGEARAALSGRGIGRPDPRLRGQKLRRTTSAA